MVENEKVFMKKLIETGVVTEVWNTEGNINGMERIVEGVKMIAKEVIGESSSTMPKGK